MSFNVFRTDLYSRIAPVLPDDQLSFVLNMLDDMSASWDFTPKETTIIPAGGLPDVVRLYIASKSVENLKRGTLENYLRVLSRFFSMVRRPVDEVTAADIRLFLNWYKETHHVQNSTLEHHRLVLYAFYEWLMNEELARRNPVRQIRPIRCEDNPRLPMTALELEMVRGACVTLREKAMVDFLYSTAARVTEFCNCKRCDVNLIDHTVRIEHGKGDKARTTFINAKSEISLRAYLHSRSDASDALFVTSCAPYRKMSKKAVENEIKRIVSRCSLSVHVTPHIFRHTAASLALQRGMPIEQVQRFLGHARIQTTLRYAKTLDLDVKLAHQRCVS